MSLSRLDTHFLKMAKMQGEKSSFSRKKRGCVIAKQNQIVATGVSSHLDTTKTETHTAGMGAEEKYVATVNAELVAIGAAVRANIGIAGATVYTSDCPNWMTFKMIATLGIRRVVHYGPCTNERITHYAKELGIEMLGVG